jgi:predicted site-specific integrase-resolvase
VTPWWLDVREIEELSSGDDIEELVQDIMEYIVNTIKNSFGMFKSLGGDE